MLQKDNEVVVKVFESYSLYDKFLYIIKGIAKNRRGNINQVKLLVYLLTLYMQNNLLIEDDRIVGIMNFVCNVEWEEELKWRLNAELQKRGSISFRDFLNVYKRGNTLVGLQYVTVSDFYNEDVIEVFEKDMSLCLNNSLDAIVSVSYLLRDMLKKIADLDMVHILLLLILDAAHMLMELIGIKFYAYYIDTISFLSSRLYECLEMQYEDVHERLVCYDIYMSFVDYIHKFACTKNARYILLESIFKIFKIKI